MMDWNAYREKLMTGIGEFQALSPETVLVATPKLAAQAPTPIIWTAKPVN